MAAATPLYERSIVPSQRSDGRFKAVCRAEPAVPKDVAGVVAHGNRTIGNVDHIVAAKADMKVMMIGDDSVARTIVEMSDDMAKFNRMSALSKRKFRNAKELNKAVESTPLKNPWRENRKSRGPLREGILSVRREFFEADDNTTDENRLSYVDDSGEFTVHDKQKYRNFFKASKEFLAETFGDDCIYARFDGDEQSGHVHFVLARVVDIEPTVRYPRGRRIFKITDHPLIGGNGSEKRGYELLQDAVGEFFETRYPEMNIIRGERRAEAKRQADKDATEVYDKAVAEGVELPAGSRDGQVLFLLKKQMKETQEKGSIRKDARDTMALDYLAAIGAITETVRNQATSRKKRAALLAQLEETYGTSAEIISKPEKVSQIHIEKTKAEIDRYSDEKKGEADDHARRMSVESMEDSFENAVSAVSVDADKDKLKQKEEELVAREQAVQKKLEAAEERALKAERAQRIAEDRMNAAEAMMLKAKTAMRQMRVLKKRISDKVPEFFGKKVEQAFDKIGIEPAQFSGEPTIPGTFLVAATEQATALRERLNGMNNAALRNGVAITSDAVNILDEPDEEMERAQARLGLKVLENEALNRGFDLKSGMHDPAKAKQKALAYLHTDQPGEPTLKRQVVKKKVTLRSR